MSKNLYHIAQFNLACIRAELDDPIMFGFVKDLTYINGLADESPGFVWRLQTPEGNSTAIRPYDDQRLLITLSVWASIEELFTFTYTKQHGERLRERKSWFEHIEEHYLVLWWVPAGHIPSVDEGKERLDHLKRSGPTEAAFTFKERYPQPEAHFASPPDAGGE